MVAAEPDKWMWDVDKRNYFKIKDIQKFSITKIELRILIFADFGEFSMRIGEARSENEATGLIEKFIRENNL